MPNPEKQTASGIILPGGVDYEEPANTGTAHQLPTIPRLGITSGFALENKLELPPVAPKESTSEFHKPKGSGETPLTSREDIHRQSTGESPLVKRKEIVERYTNLVLAKSEVISAGDNLAEVRPILLGVRKAITAIRLEMTKKALARQAEDTAVITRAAKNISPPVVAKKFKPPENAKQTGINIRITRSKSYKRPDDPLRPVTPRQRQIVEGLQTAKERRVKEQSEYLQFGHSYGEDVHRTDKTKETADGGRETERLGYLSRTTGRRPTTEKEASFRAKTRSRAHRRMRRFESLKNHHERVVDSERSKLVSLAKKKVRLEKRKKQLEEAGEKLVSTVQ